MYNPNEKVKFNISKCLKDLNKKYHKNYTLQDLANDIKVSRETLSRVSSDSSFSLIYKIASQVYYYYTPDIGGWEFTRYVEFLAFDEHSFIL